MASSINEKELNKLLKNLKKLPQKLNKSIVNLGLKAGAKTIQKEAQHNVVGDLGGHSDYHAHNMGDLEDAITVRKKGIRSSASDGDGRNVTTYQVGIKLDGTAWFAHFVEFGSKLHAPQPFMTPAYEQNGRQAITAIKEYMKRRFNSAVKKGII